MDELVCGFNLLPRGWQDSKGRSLGRRSLTVHHSRSRTILKPQVPDVEPQGPSPPRVLRQHHLPSAAVNPLRMAIARSIFPTRQLSHSVSSRAKAYSSTTLDSPCLSSSPKAQSEQGIAFRASAPGKLGPNRTARFWHGYPRTKGFRRWTGCRHPASLVYGP